MWRTAHFYHFLLALQPIEFSMAREVLFQQVWSIVWGIFDDNSTSNIAVLCLFNTQLGLLKVSMLKHQSGFQYRWHTDWIFKFICDTQIRSSNLDPDLICLMGHSQPVQACNHNVITHAHLHLSLAAILQIRRRFKENECARFQSWWRPWHGNLGAQLTARVVHQPDGHACMTIWSTSLHNLQFIVITIAEQSHIELITLGEAVINDKKNIFVFRMQVQRLFSHGKRFLAKLYARSYTRKGSPTPAETCLVCLVYKWDRRRAIMKQSHSEAQLLVLCAANKHQLPERRTLAWILFQCAAYGCHRACVFQY